jgi:predicted esterase
LAAAGLVIGAERFSVAVAHTVCLAGAFMVRDPISGAQLPTELPGENRVPFTLLHGADDDVIPADVSRKFASTLRDNGWPVDCHVLAADHASIAGAAYDRAADRYSPASDPATLAVADDVAARIAAVAT